MANEHEARMATIVSDRDPGVPERLQSLESSVFALSVSVAFQRSLAWLRVHVAVSMAKSSPSSIALERVSECLKTMVERAM